jgi:hypothetical protein
MKSITPGYMLMTHDPLCITKKKHSRNKKENHPKTKATEFGSLCGAVSFKNHRNAE